MVSVSRTSRLARGLLLLVVLLAVCPAPPLSADGGAPNLAYVAGTAEGVSVIDIAQRRVSRTFAVAGDPRTLLLSADGRFLYVTQPALRRIVVLAAQTGQTVCTVSLPEHPILLALSSDATVLYAAGEAEANVFAIDPVTCAVQRTFQTGGPVSGLAVAAVNTATGERNQIWVAGTSALTVFDEQGQSLASIPIMGGPLHLCIPGGLTVYVTTRNGHVLAVDMDTLSVSPPLLSGGVFGSMDDDAITGEVYVPDQRSNLLDVLTPVIVGTLSPPHEPARVIPLGWPPQAVAITSDGQLGFVALSSGKVVMLDLPGRDTITTFLVGGTPHFIITGLYPPVGGSPSGPGPGPRTNGLRTLLICALLLLAAVSALVCFVWRRRGGKETNAPSHP